MTNILWTCLDQRKLLFDFAYSDRFASLLHEACRRFRVCVPVVLDADQVLDLVYFGRDLIRIRWDEISVAEALGQVSRVGHRYVVLLHPLRFAVLVPIHRHSEIIR